MGGINVPIDRIVPLTDTRDNFSKIVADIETTDDGLYVLTKGGKPAIALISIHFLEKLMAGLPADTQNSAPVKAPVEIAPKSPSPTTEIAQKLPSEERPADVPTVVKPPMSTMPPKPPYQPKAPNNPAMPPISATAPKPAIDPSWTGQKTASVDTGAAPAEPTPVKKPTSPWPILPPRPAAPAPAAQQPAANSVPTVAPASPAPPPVTPTSFEPRMPANANVAPQPPAAPPAPTPVTPPVMPAAPVPPPPTNPVVPPFTQSVPAPTVPLSQPAASSVPPPPVQSATIPFDEPPKLDIESSETMASPSAEPNDALPKPATPPAPAVPAAPAPIQDIEI